MYSLPTDFNSFVEHEYTNIYGVSALFLILYENLIEN